LFSEHFQLQRACGDLFFLSPMCDPFFFPVFGVFSPYGLLLTFFLFCRLRAFWFFFFLPSLIRRAFCLREQKSYFFPPFFPFAILLFLFFSSRLGLPPKKCPPLLSRGGPIFFLPSRFHRVLPPFHHRQFLLANFIFSDRTARYRFFFFPFLMKFLIILSPFFSATRPLPFFLLQPS